MSVRMTKSHTPLLPTRQAKRTPERARGVPLVLCLRLLELELRRGTGILGAAAIAVATFWMMWMQLPNGVVYWEGVNRSAGMAMAPVAAIAGGIAAWEASREHRRRTSEQMGSTSFPVWAQQAMSVLAITMWAVTGYLIMAMGFYGYASTKATWAGLEFGYPLLVVGALIGAIGFGWLVGTIWQRTIAPLMIVVVIWGGDLVWETTNGLRSIFGFGSSGFEVSPEQINSANPPQPPSGLETFFQNNGAWRYLIPSEYINQQVVATNVTGWAVLWMAGLGVVFFLVRALVARDGSPRWEYSPSLRWLSRRSAVSARRRNTISCGECGPSRIRRRHVPPGSMGRSRCACTRSRRRSCRRRRTSSPTS